MIMNRALINFPQNRFYLKTWRWPEIARHEPHNSAIISQRSKNEGWNNQGFKAPRHRGFISWGGPSWKFTTWLSYLDTIFQETVHALIRIQRLFGHRCLCVSTQLKFYKAAIKFHDDNDCKMADAVIVAAMATKRPWGRVKLMKCGAISKKGFLINGNHFILIIFFLSDSTTKSNNNRLAFLWRDDANRSDFPGNSLTSPATHGSFNTGHSSHAAL